MKTNDIVDAFSKYSGMKKGECKALLDKITGFVAEVLASGEPIEIFEFGRFETRISRPVRHYNIQTGEMFMSKEKKKVRFRPSVVLNRVVNEE